MLCTEGKDCRVVFSGRNGKYPKIQNMNISISFCKTTHVAEVNLDAFKVLGLLVPNLVLGFTLGFVWNSK